MLESITVYPQVLVLNVTYQTNVNNMARLNVMCIDNNGQGRPVLHASCKMSVLCTYKLAYRDCHLHRNVPGQRDSGSEEEYNNLRDQMAAACPPDVVQYFEEQCTHHTLRKPDLVSSVEPPRLMSLAEDDNLRQRRWRLTSAVRDRVGEVHNRQPTPT
ncbi:hypothetical protein RRG08_001490 [Elysia crispata]|uniref:ZSWIM1/3 RNaseH-like domain-containing protein n=1 Tax=Elysia crispata TaxID=231223 RepID=A0AAE1ABZ5_9GAST|nr:hypothetical protein RRG08_001490 [Elysia crispata]